jgi:hypothetical protein
MTRLRRSNYCFYWIMVEGKIAITEGGHAKASAAIATTQPKG